MNRQILSSFIRTLGFACLFLLTFSPVFAQNIDEAGRWSEKTESAEPSLIQNVDEVERSSEKTGAAEPALTQGIDPVTLIQNIETEFPRILISEKFTQNVPESVWDNDNGVYTVNTVRQGVGTWMMYASEPLEKSESYPIFKPSLTTVGSLADFAISIQVAKIREHPAG